MTPTKMFFTKGVGTARQQLMSFELALRSAGIEKFNLVSVSSILPPGCQRIPKEKGLEMLKPGEIVYCVMARNSTNEPNRLIAASIGCAIPAGNDQQYGYLSEHHPFGENEQKTSDCAEDLAATMLATTLGVEFDPNTAWDEREKVYKLSGKIVNTTNITQSAEGNKNGLWTTVVAVAVFVPQIFLESIEAEIKSGGGAVFDSINKKQIEEIKIPLLPIETRRQLVAEMEEQEKIIEASKKLVGIMEQKIAEASSKILGHV